MRLVKSLALAVLCGAAGTAFGQYSSPELMMVTDSGGTLANGTVVAPRIERYDPYTGAYLGSFGTGYVTNPYGIAVIGQDAYVSDPFTYNGTQYSRIDVFNFSTGAYDGSVFSTSPYNIWGLAKYGTYLLASDAGNTSTGADAVVYTFNSSGTETSFYTMPSGTFPMSIAADSSHDYVATYEGGLYSYNLNSTGVTTSLNFHATPADYLYGVAVNEGDVFAAGYSSTNSDGQILEYNTSGVLQGTYTSTSNTPYSLAFGHNGMLYALTNDNTIQRFDGNYNIEYGPLGSFDLSETADAERIAVYAAPEPASMFGLALGALALIARRRRRK